MRGIAAAGLLLFVPMLASAQHDSHRHHHGAPAASDEAPIRVTISPEARVSVVMTGAALPSRACGVPSDIAVRIVNHGFVTAPLQVSFAGDSPAGAMLEFSSDPLSGAPEELRTLGITLGNRGPTDLTVAFKTRNNAPDLGGRDRVHFLLDCQLADD